MKKFRRILSFVVALAMIMSMSTLCFLVTAEGSSTQTGTETEWSLSANAFEIGDAGSTALFEKGPFKLDLVGKTLSATVVDVNGVASIQSTDGVTAFAKSTSGIIDLAPAAGDARVVFTAPADGTYAFIASLEKTDMPAYAEGSIVKNWTQIGATETAGGGFTSGWGYAGKGIGNDSSWASGVNTVLSQSAAVELTAGQCITVSVSKEGDCDNTHTTLKTFSVSKIEDGVIWSMGDEFKIGDVGSTAVISSGFFGIDLKGKTLDPTVVENGGVASIVSTDDTPVRAFTKSETGIIDITPGAGCAQVYFMAPADGTYWFAIAAEKTDMSGLADGETVKNWTEIGPKASLASGYNTTTGFASGVNYTGAAIGNTTGFTLKNVYFSGKATLTAGQVITITVNKEGTSSETQTTLKSFDVMKLPSTATADAFASTIGTPDALGTVTANNFTLGSINSVTNNLEGTSFRPVDATKLVPAWAGATNYYAWSVFVNEADRPIFGTSQTGSSMDMMPKNAVPSVITYTAPSDGVYFYDAMFKRSSGSSDKTLYMIVGTGNASGAYVGELEKTAIAANQTLLVNGTAELKAGDTIWFVAENSAAAASAEVGVQKIEVTRIGDYVEEEEHVCSEWNDDGTCKTNATCVSCGEKTGATNANNHELDTFTYTDNEDGATHTKKNACCGATVDATEAHVFEDGECDCGATYIAPAYSAGLATDTASVRKNQTAYVTVDIAGTNAKYAAGEIVVTFNDDIFNFNEAASTLPANTEVEATTGKIVLIITGADKEFGAEGAIVKLAFDAVAETTGSDITLSSAAFSLRADAKSEDLTAAVITTATVSVEVTKQVFNVSVGDNLTADAEQVTEGDAFEFTYSAADSAYYDYDITVMSGTTDITEFVTFADGKWTVPAQYITDDLTITTTEPTAKEFGVTITPDGYATGNANAYYKTDYTFVIKADDGDESSTEKYNTYVLGEITIGGVKYEGATSLDGKNYTIPGTAITGAIVITIDTVEQDPGSVNVTVNAPADVTVDAEDKATLGQAFEFTVDFSQADPLYTYTVLYNGTPIEAVEGVYTTPNVTAPVVITVEKTLKTAVSVKFEKEYLDLGEAGKMWLVLNDMDKLDGKVYTINGEEMFWSDRYEAYCYIVIADEAPAANSFAIDIIDGTVTEIDYGMNVNKSLNVDANDAQLVYDMYNKEYTSFDVVTTEKFLRADVNETVDFLVDTGDATAIITACVEKYIPND